MSRYLKTASSVIPSQEKFVEDEVPAPKTRRARGTSEFVQVKVHRSIYEALAVVGKARSMKVADVVEKILEVHVAPVNSALASLKMDDIF